MLRFLVFSIVADDTLNIAKSCNAVVGCGKCGKEVLGQ
jgi:hypothetical protein